MFVRREENHATALAGSGFSDAPGIIVGIYTARERRPGEAWTFISISAWAMGGNRVAPDRETLRAAASAFEASGYGDVRRALARL
ncbi:MAG: hypothetical protein U0838_03035 [Chloroflexota bacterium]